MKIGKIYRKGGKKWPEGEVSKELARNDIHYLSKIIFIHFYDL